MVTSPLTRAEYLRLAFTEQVALQARLLGPADVAVAVAIAAVGGVLIGATGAWPVIAVVTVLVIVQRILIARRARAAARALRAIAERRPDLKEWTTGEVRGLPVHLLEPEDAIDAAQLERILVPTAEDRRALAAAAPATMATPSLAVLGVVVGLLLAVGGSIAIVLGVRGPGILVPIVVSLPLVGLGMDFFRAVEVLRGTAVLLVDRAREQLPRLWAEDPNGSSGAAVRSVGDAYALDERAIPILTARARRPWVVPVALSVIGLGSLAMVVFVQYLS